MRVRSGGGWRVEITGQVTRVTQGPHTQRARCQCVQAGHLAFSNHLPDSRSCVGPGCSRPCPCRRHSVRHSQLGVTQPPAVTAHCRSHPLGAHIKFLPCNSIDICCFCTVATCWAQPASPPEGMSGRDVLFSICLLRRWPCVSNAAYPVQHRIHGPRVAKYDQCLLPNEIDRFDIPMIFLELYRAVYIKCAELHE